MKKHPKIFRWFLKTTDIMKGPNDIKLDQEIEKFELLFKELFIDLLYCFLLFL